MYVWEDHRDKPVCASSYAVTSYLIVHVFNSLLYPFVGVEVHLPPLCHPKYTSIQAQQEEGKALETFVQSVLLRCSVVRREDLCIAEGRHVWKLNVEIQCLSHEGSLGDACILAAASALADVRLPATAVDKDEEVIVLPGKACVALLYVSSLKPAFSLNKAVSLLFVLHIMQFLSHTDFTLFLYIPSPHSCIQTTHPGPWRSPASPSPSPSACTPTNSSATSPSRKKSACPRK